MNPNTTNVAGYMANISITQTENHTRKVAPGQKKLPKLENLV